MEHVVGGKTAGFRKVKWKERDQVVSGESLMWRKANPGY